MFWFFVVIKLILLSVICSLTENIVSMNAAQSETPFGSKVRKGMFRTVSQLYKVCLIFGSFIAFCQLTSQY